MNIKYLCLVLMFIVFLFLIPGQARATKPCQPSPCENEYSQFDREKCKGVSDWIALGLITNVDHNFKEAPLNKDFATFILSVKNWEKQGKIVKSDMSFTVGWCHNRQELPVEVNGTFRFYGSDEKTPDGGSQYLYFESLSKNQDPLPGL